MVNCGKCQKPILIGQLISYVTKPERTTLVTPINVEPTLDKLSNGDILDIYHSKCLEELIYINVEEKPEQNNDVSAEDILGYLKDSDSKLELEDINRFLEVNDVHGLDLETVVSLWFLQKK